MTTLLVLSLELIRIGGTPADLMQSLAEVRKEPAIAVVHTTRNIRQFRVEVRDEDLLARTMRKDANLAMAPGVDLAFHMNALPHELFSLLRSESRPQAMFIEPEKTGFEVKDGKVMLNTKKAEGIQLQNLDRTPWSKPLQMHWIYELSYVVGKVDPIGEGDFLKKLAKAAGARFWENKDGFYLELDPDQVKFRAINTLKPYTLDTAFSRNTSEEVRNERLYKRNLAIKALESLSRAEFAELVKTKSGSLQLLNRTALNAIVRNRAKYLLDQYKARLNNPPEERRFGDFDYSGLNLNGPVGVEINAQFEAKGLIEYRNPRNGRVTTLRI